MPTLQYSMIVKHPLEDVVAHLAEFEEAMKWGPEGGMRFKTIPGGTYVTVFGVGSEFAPDMLSALIDSMVTPTTNLRTAV